MRPIVLQDVENIAANATVDNVLTNTRIVQCPISGFATLYLQAAGASPGEVEAGFFVNSDEVLIQSGVGNADRMPETDKDAYFRRVRVRQGDRLTLRGANTTAGALNFYWRIQLDPYNR